jgi:hypothetical protein
MRHSWRPSESIIKSISAGLAVAVSIVTLLGAFYGLPLYVETLVDKRLKDKEVIEKLAKSIRPSMIFDSNGSTIADLGALEYIESVKILEYYDKEKKAPVAIEVKPKKPLVLPPLLTSIDSYQFAESVKRGQGSMWIFTLTPLAIAADVPPFRFRLEVLQ